MAEISFVTKNIYEDSLDFVTGTPDTGFPQARLGDRQISLYWKTTISSTHIFIRADQGASVVNVDFLAVERHNFSGLDIRWQHSTDNSTWDHVSGSPWTQADNLKIIKTISSPATYRYWRIVAESATNPYCGEVWMGERWTHDILAKPSPEAADIANVSWQKTTGGLMRSTKFGEVRRSRVYEMALSAADLAGFQAAMEDLDGHSLPFWFCDHTGAWFLAKFSEVPREIYSNKTHTWVQVAVEELL